MSRCVRRAFLCGTDDYTGENFDHRKPWFLARLKLAAEVFAIDVCAYAIMSNHFHVVLRIDAERAAEWSDEAVLRRYGKLFPQAARASRALRGRDLTQRIALLRERLSDISWFMRVVCEYVARRANKEDKVTGRFWEGRFKSQALLDESALYTCMSYVDLNPLRAGIATSLEDSSFTSIKQRLDEAAAKKGKTTPLVPLAPLFGEGRVDRGKRRVLEIRYRDYVELLQWTGRIQGAAVGSLKGAPSKVLGKLGIDVGAWLATMGSKRLSQMTTLGCEARMDAEAERRGLRWLRGKRAAAGLFSGAG